MTPDDFTAPDRPEDLNPPEPNDTLRTRIIRILDAADDVGIPIGSVNVTHGLCFVRAGLDSTYSREQAMSLVAALDVAAPLEIDCSESGHDWLCARLDQPEGSLCSSKWQIRIQIAKQVYQGDRDEAADTIGRLAGWTIPPDWMDPSVVALAYRTALARVTSPADLVDLVVAAKVLGVIA